MTRITHLLWPVLLLAAPLVVAAADPSATILSRAGEVDAAMAADPEQWSPAAAGQGLDTGDRLRTGERSRAAIRLSNLSVLRVNELTTLLIQDPSGPDQSSVLDLRRGAVHFFHRDRPTTRFNTPTAAGAIRGTEFHLEVLEEGATVLTLLEGEVELENEAGSVRLVGGEQATVEAGQPPRKTAVIDAVNIIQWALYYPGVLNPDDLELEPAAASALADSLEAYRSGDLLQALALHADAREPDTGAERVYLAALLLSVGNVDEALDRLAGIPAGEGRPARLADALRETIAAVKGEPWERVAPRTLATEWLAGSYQAQALWRLEEALQMARAAYRAAPDFGFASARVAELEFSFGRTEAAMAALEASLAAAPQNAQAVALRGFLLAAQGRHGTAEESFNLAIELDGALANAWLGRGLIRIREGEAEEGREDLQIAAALEPTRSLLRSYLAKGFEHTSDQERAERELEHAQRLDPNDPTPWLYSALLNHRRHRTNQAVRELERSQALNDNRRVFRSRLLLDQDRAVRSANLAAIYRDAGLTDYSVREASRAVHHDYTNYSAHLFLANSYDALRDPAQIDLRYETPWLAEWLIANLLAPVGAGGLSQHVSQQEYSRLFEGDHLGASWFSEYQSDGDWAVQASQFGVQGQTGYSIDAGYRVQEGDRPNHDFENRYFSAQVKQQVTPNDGIFLQAAYQRHVGGDLLRYYDPAMANRSIRTREVQEPNLFAGYHREWSPGNHTLLLAGRFDDTFSLRDENAGIFTISRDADGNVTGFPLRQFEHEMSREFSGYSLEAQQIRQADRHTLLVGGRFQSGSVESRSTTVRTPPTAFPPGVYGPPGSPASDQEVEADLDRASLYGYHLWEISDRLHLSTGLAYDYIRYPMNTDLSPLSEEERTRSRLSPKAGMIWTPRTGTTVRGAYTRSLGGLFYDQSVRLEPVQVAGFTQAYRSMIPESVGGVIAGSRFTSYGVGIDQEILRNTYFTIEAEWLESEAERTVGVFDHTAFAPRATPSGTAQELEFEEKSVIVAVNRLLGNQWAVGARYRVSQADLTDRFPEIPEEESPFARRDLQALLHRLDLRLIWQHERGFFTEGESVWHAQSNRGYEPELAGDDFWQFHAYAGWRLPRRHGELRVGVLNITDEDYRLNPLNLYATLPRERTFLASVRLSF